MPPTNGNQYAPTSWNRSYYEDLETPSGQLCQVRRPGLEALMREGVISRIDKLTDLVDKRHVKRVRRPHEAAMEEIDIGSLASDPEGLMDLLVVVDRVVESIVIQPKVQRPIVRDEDGQPALNAQGKEQTLLPSDRDPNVVYTDYVELDDRMFLFNYAVGGSADLERFRGELGKSVGGLGSREDVEPATE